MKAVLISAVMISCTSIVCGQNTGTIIAQQAGQGVKQGAEVATEKTGQNLGNKLLNRLFDKKKKKKEDNQANSSNQSQSANATSTQNASTSNAASTTENNKTSAASSFQAYSKFDFVPGTKVIAYDDFSKDAVGDYPVTWNTNSSGEVVTLSSRDGHWLMVNKVGKFIPEYIKSLPDNFTLEYDIVANAKYNSYSPFLSIYCLSGAGGKDLFDNWFLVDGKRSGVKVSLHPTGGINNSGLADIETFEQGKSVIKNDVNINQFNGDEGKSDLHAHVAIWRQKQRIRVYVNEAKVFDLPRAFAADTKYTSLMFEIWSDMKNQDQYMIGNLKLSEGDPDTRNQLLNEGKFVTRGILFDVNSDKIKPESYGALKDIANVLSENTTIKVKIVGHTDADGSADANLVLSKKRAASVKNTLVNDFGIDASRLETDGKGASQPVDTNATPEGKANNRRVEFIKI